MTVPTRLGKDTWLAYLRCTSLPWKARGKLFLFEKGSLHVTLDVLELALQT